jgi:nucleoside phosphorylase
MLLITAALEEELRACTGLFEDRRRIQAGGIHLWEAARGNKVVRFLKTGVGPAKSAASLAAALEYSRPSRILVIGYAGALDPGLKLGSLVAVRRALAFSLNESCPDWEHIRLDRAFDLADCEILAQFAKSLGLNACTGDVMTSSHVLGAPAHKRALYKNFHASITDMETAALAGTAASRRIPLSCIRAISDEAGDTFLEPFSYNPAAHMAARARKLMDRGMVRTYRRWRSNASIARKSLSRFLASYP